MDHVERIPDKDEVRGSSPRGPTLEPLGHGQKPDLTRQSTSSLNISWRGSLQNLCASAYRMRSVVQGQLGPTLDQSVFTKKWPPTRHDVQVLVQLTNNITSACSTSFHLLCATGGQQPSTNLGRQMEILREHAKRQPARSRVCLPAQRASRSREASQTDQAIPRPAQAVNLRTIGPSDSTLRHASRSSSRASEVRDAT